MLPKEVNVRKIQKFLSFLEFSLEYKMPKLVKNMTLEQLSDLCCSFYPVWMVVNLWLIEVRQLWWWE